jgi:DNA repair protein RecO (recombination protein O)
MMKRGCAVLATNKSSALSRVVDEPAFVLQTFDWSETSLIVEALTQHFGRITLVAKGAKRPSSSFRPILLPLQILKITYSGDADIKTLKSATWGGGSVMPKGEALLSGFYLNELLLRMLARDDPHPTLFETYEQVVDILSVQDDSVKAPALRAFELLLLKDLGWLPDFGRQSLTLQPLKGGEVYSWIAEVGLREQESTQLMGLSGTCWSQLHHALNDSHPLSALVRVCAEFAQQNRQSLQTQVRAVLHYHCGVSKLRTRQFMMDVQSLQA